MLPQPTIAAFGTKQRESMLFCCVFRKPVQVHVYKLLLLILQYASDFNSGYRHYYLLVYVLNTSI